MAPPLFKFPVLVIKLILETMGFIEIFLLTNSSSKPKRIVKNLVTIRNYEMKLYLMSETTFAFEFRNISSPTERVPFYLDQRQNQRRSKFSLKIGGSEPLPTRLRNADGIYFLVIYTDTRITTGTQLYNALREVFKVPLQELAVYLDDVAVETYKSWLEWNNELFYDIPVLNFIGKCGFSDYIWILKNFRTRHQLYFQTEPTEYPEAFEIPNFGAETVFIDHGRWIKLQHLNSIQAKEIAIWRVSLTDFEINTFLRDWKTKETSNLKHLAIFFDREADSEVFLEGIDATDENLTKPDNVLNQWSFELASGQKCTVLYSQYGRNEFGFEFWVENN